MKNRRALVPYVLFMATHFASNSINKINQNNSISVIAILHVAVFFCPTPNTPYISHWIMLLKLIIYIREVTCFHAHIIAMRLEFALLTSDSEMK